MNHNLLFIIKSGTNLIMYQFEKLWLEINIGYLPK